MIFYDGKQIYINLKKTIINIPKMDMTLFWFSYLKLRSGYICIR